MKRGKCRSCRRAMITGGDLCPDCGAKRQARRGAEKKAEEERDHWLKGWG